MIVSRIIGGLGNQMFQYAVARHLAEINHSPLKLDTSGFDHYQLFGFGLNHFNISAEIAGADELAPFFRARKAQRGLRKLFAGWRPDPSQYIKEQSLRFNPDILRLSGEVYLDGHWQTELYFLPIRTILLREFTLAFIYSESFQRLAEEIQNCHAVALHIRRGDYVSNAKTLRIHGTCTPEYYQRAATEIASHHDRLVFYVFSDDIDWTRDNLRLHPHNMRFISRDRSLKDSEELILMSMCHHNIIANSTFSWWGAWLNQNPEKIVIAPSRWFNDPDKDATDIAPAGWKRM